MKENTFNAIYLENWYGQPIHCPFCGQAMDPEAGDGVVDCRHWLYTRYEDFLERSDRFNLVSGIPLEDHDAALSIEITEKFGNAWEIVEANREKFSNLVEYQIDTVSDVTWIGFAPIDAELVLFGHEAISPCAKPELDE